MFTLDAGWLPRSESFRYWRSAASGHRTSSRAWTTFAPMGMTSRFETVPYEFQRGGNQMMRIRRLAIGPSGRATSACAATGVSTSIGASQFAGFLPAKGLHQFLRDRRIEAAR